MLANKRSLSFFVICLILSLTRTGVAAEVSPLANPGPGDNGLWLIDPNSRDQYGQVGRFPPDSRWHIAQWGILNPLPLKTKQNGNGWKTQNKDARVWVYPDKTGGYVVDLKQSSKNADYGAREFDLFLEPNHFISPSLPQNLKHYSDLPSLSELAGVYLKARQEVISAWHGIRGYQLTGFMGMDYASTLLAVVLINPYTTPEQILFYQVTTYDSRGWLFEGFWFDNGTRDGPYLTFGVDDSVEIHGSPSLTFKKANTYNLNIGDRLKQLVLSGPPSLDKDLNHWRMGGGLYFGSIVNGEATIRSKVSLIDVAYEIQAEIIP